MLFLREGSSNSGWRKTQHLSTKYANTTSSETITHLILQHFQQVIIIVAPVNHHHPQNTKPEDRPCSRLGASHCIHKQSETYCRTHESNVITILLSCWRRFCSPVHTQGHVPGTHWDNHLQIHLRQCYVHTRTHKHSHAHTVAKWKRSSLMRFIHLSMCCWWFKNINQQSTN